MLKDGSTSQYIDPFLKDGACTRFRILPALDMESGEELLAMNPEAVITEDTPFEEIFSDTLLLVEVADGIGTTASTFISSVTHDRAGNAIQERWSPTKVVCRKLSFKLQEAALLKGAGRPTDVPDAWGQWYKDSRRLQRLTKAPSDLILMQVMAYEINGEIKKNAQTEEPEWVTPAVLPIPRSAQANFLTDLKTKERSDEDLSPGNNIFGDFCTCAAGSILMLRKIAASGESDRNSYNIRKLSAMPLDINMVKENWKPWDEVVRLPTVEDTIEWLIEAFDGAAVAYALRGGAYESYIPVEYAHAADSIADCVNIKDLKVQLSTAAPTGTPAYTPPGAPPAAPAIGVQGVQPVSQSTGGYAAPPVITTSAGAVGYPPPVVDAVVIPPASSSEFAAERQDADIVPPPPATGVYTEDGNAFSAALNKIQNPGS
jgi:hypothetical protein